MKRTRFGSSLFFKESLFGMNRSLNLYIEQEMADIAVFHFIFLAF